MTRTVGGRASGQLVSKPRAPAFPALIPLPVHPWETTKLIRRLLVLILSLLESFLFLEKISGII